MPRQKNTRLTSIYWLIDTRPETVAAGWLQGLPFYCGKTVQDLARRLGQHRCKQTSTVGFRLLECGNFIQMKIMEIVSIEQDWVLCERFWIATLRHFHPDCLNITEGGEGAPGFVQSKEARAKISATHRGKALSSEHRAMLSKVSKGRKFSSDHCTKISASKRGTKLSLEHRTKLSTTLRGKKRSIEHCTNLSIALRGKNRSTEHCANLSIAAKNRSSASYAKIAAAHKELWKSPEHRAKMSIARQGRTHSPETRAKMRIAHQRRRALVPRSPLPQSDTSNPTRPSPDPAPTHCPM